jgi:hypothetical protein
VVVALEKEEILIGNGVVIVVVERKGQNEKQVENEEQVENEKLFENKEQVENVKLFL